MHLPYALLTIRLRSLFILAGLLLCLTLGLMGPAFAESPSRTARVVETWGTTWIFDPQDRQWTALTRNQTLSEGDRIRTDARSRVAVRLGSTSIWIDEASDLEISALSDQQAVFRLEKGRLGMLFRSAAIASEYRVQTREGQLFAEQEGALQVEQLDRGTIATNISSRLRFDFKADSTGTSQRTGLREGEQAEFWWVGGPRTERQRVQETAFGAWIAEQSGEEGRPQMAAERYVSPEMTGTEELDRHGRWENSPEYGNVWIPTTVSANWAPYRDGRWSWSVQWGWTWIDVAPWGFAPFHYGRWVEWRGRWSWVPGPRIVRPHRPSHWTPEVPREIHRPSFSRSETYRPQRPAHIEPNIHKPYSREQPNEHTPTVNRPSTRHAPEAMPHMTAPQAESRPEMRTEARPQARVQPTPEPRPQARTEVRNEVRPESRPQPRQPEGKANSDRRHHQEIEK